MQNSDRNELRKRFKKDNSITKLSLCYVNADKEIIVRQDEDFKLLAEEDMFKFLDIAKKSLGGNVGDNLLELTFTSKQEEDDGYRLLAGLRESRLTNPALADALFDKVIQEYEGVGNFLITIIYDDYDVPVKTSDKMRLDESEEVFSYILISICPVAQTKPGLGYLSAPNRMGSREKDWVAGAPEMAFMFPSFSDRSADIHHMYSYTKNPADTHDELIKNIFGCDTKHTATQCREAMETAIAEIAEGDSETLILNVHEALAEKADEAGSEGDGFSITPDAVQTALESILDDEDKVKAEKIGEACKEYFGNEEPDSALFVDRKTLKAKEAERREKELLCENAALMEQLRGAGLTPDTVASKDRVRIRLPKEKAGLVKMSDDGMFVMVPVNKDSGYDVVTI